MIFSEVLIRSKEIRKLVVERSFLYRIPFRFLCTECGFDYDNFMSGYINSKDSEFFNTTEEKFVKMLGILGIKVRHQVVIDKSVDMEKVSRELSDKYEEKKGVRITKI